MIEYTLYIFPALLIASPFIAWALVNWLIPD